MSLFPLVLIKSVNHRPIIMSRSVRFIFKRFEFGPLHYMGLEIVLAVLKSYMKDLLHAAFSLKVGSNTIAETSAIICHAATSHVRR
jgi:hypothetical protein